MERNEETLSTRDLASPNEPVGGGGTVEDDAGNGAVPEGQLEVYDQHPEQESGAPVGEDPQLAPDERARASAGEQAEVPASQQTPAPAVDTREQDGGTAQPTTDAGASASDAGGSLLPAEMDASFQQRWKEIQTRFVDEPRGAVEDADSLVANLMQQLAEGFAKERERLEAQWGRGEDISTEDLRVALQRYRSFFQRLLST